MTFKGLTPLRYAAIKGNLIGITALLQKGANMNAKLDNGLTPLHILCKASTTSTALRSQAVADVLLRCGADETVADNDGNTPIDLIADRAKNSRRLQRVLTNAPVDRAWRRRGFLVMSRAFSDRALINSGKGRSGKVRRGGAGRGRRGGSVGRGSGLASVLTRVVELDDDSIFRTVVGYL
ncbi:unnamed protein product [Pylaiella littoralis]